MIKTLIVINCVFNFNPCKNSCTIVDQNSAPLPLNFIARLMNDIDILSTTIKNEHWEGSIFWLLRQISFQQRQNDANDDRGTIS